MKQAFVWTVRDALRALGIAAAACLIWLLLNRLGLGGLGLLLWALAVAGVARLCPGYFWGAAMALLGLVPLALLDLPGLGPPAGVWAVSCLCWLAVAFLSGPAPARPLTKALAQPDLIRALAHDFRSPLTAIAGALEIAMEKEEVLSGRERLELLKTAQDEARWLTRLSENILALSRAAGQAGLNQGPEAAEEILAGALEQFKRRFPAIAVSVQMPARPVWLAVDGILIRQVLINLLENAALHGKTVSSIRLEVAVQGRKALFTVRDNGAGLDPALLPRLFTEDLPGQDQAGTGRRMGLGLKVCATIIQAHAGRIWAANNPEGGASFSFELATLENRHEE